MPVPEPADELDARTPSRPWPAVMSTDTAASYCDMTVSHWRKLDKSGWCPMPLKIGRKLMWRRTDLDAWIAAEFPARDADAAAAYAAATRGTLNTLPRTRTTASGPHRLTTAMT